MSTSAVRICLYIAFFFVIKLYDRRTKQNERTIELYTTNGVQGETFSCLSCCYPLSCVVGYKIPTRSRRHTTTKQKQSTHTHKTQNKTQWLPTSVRVGIYLRKPWCVVLIHGTRIIDFTGTIINRYCGGPRNLLLGKCCDTTVCVVVDLINSSTVLINLAGLIGGHLLLNYWRSGEYRLLVRDISRGLNVPVFERWCWSAFLVI